MLRRYLMFAGSTYYPGGGWQDFRDSFETVEQAKQAARALATPGMDAPDWYQVVDRESGDLVEEGSTF